MTLRGRKNAGLDESMAGIKCRNLRTVHLAKLKDLESDKYGKVRHQ